MQFISVQTRIMEPPQDDLFGVFDEYLSGVEEGDVLVVSSKIVAIHEGNCVSAEGTSKASLALEQADLTIPRSYWHSPLTVVHSAFIGTSGIDESNANGYLVSLPKDPFRSAHQIHEYLKKRFGLTNIGVIITDSHSSPLRRGAIGVAIGFWGFEPTIDCVGKPDLFGREMQVEVSDLADGLAAGAGVVMGETNECTPIIIARNAPGLTFTERNTKNDLFVPFAEDTFRVLYEKFIK